MSIHIYDGFRFKSKRTREFLLRGQACSLQRFEEWIDRNIALQELLKLPQDTYKNLLRLRLTELESQMKMAAIGSPYHGYGVEIGFMLFNGSDGYTYGWDFGQFALNGPEVADFVEEYGYWDNTDKPDEIHATEWKTRGRKWKREVLDGFHEGNRMTARLISFLPEQTITSSWLWLDYYDRRLNKKTQQEDTDGTDTADSE